MPDTLRFRPREGWLSVGLLAVMVWAVVHSIEEAGWVEHLDSLVPLALCSLLVGLVAAKSHLRRWVAHLASALLGLELIVLVYANRMSRSEETRLNSSHVAISYAVFCLKKKKAAGSQGGRRTTRRSPPSSPAPVSASVPGRLRPRRNRALDRHPHGVAPLDTGAVVVAVTLEA